MSPIPQRPDPSLHAPAEDEGATTSPIEGLGAASAALPLPSAGMVVGTCVDARHPTLLGRVLCSVLASDGTTAERWVPTLMNLPVREGDRVLLVRPHNHAEPIVVGVLDGFSPRPAPSTSPTAIRALQADETVRFESARGEPLVEIAPGATGPVVRLLSADLEVETPGAVRLRAGSIELHAREGEVRVEASDDVVVQGEAIHLN
jgi:hypothetical protein